MSQRALAKRAKIPQSTVSKVESGALKPNVATLQKMLNANNCDLLITPVLRNKLEETRKKQAVKKVEYLQGAMSLEKQEPNQALLNESMKKWTSY